ncbi:MAG TPA: hypothetical protein VJM08_02945 [Anaerolineales bacterium]|nr:hypothetical protein [Anaerolineales bacterium]
MFVIESVDEAKGVGDTEVVVVGLFVDRAVGVKVGAGVLIGGSMTVMVGWLVGVALTHADRLIINRNVTPTRIQRV